jgi:hypothetical protein
MVREHISDDMWVPGCMCEQGAGVSHFMSEQRYVRLVVGFNMMVCECQPAFCQNVSPWCSEELLCFLLLLPGRYDLRFFVMFRMWDQCGDVETF